MTTQEIIQNIPNDLFNEDGNTPVTRILVRGEEVTVLPTPYLVRAGDEVFDYSKNNGAIEIIPIDNASYQKEFVTAEEWINSQGYTPTRIVTLMDLENKLRFTNKTSQKVTAVRAWLDGILTSYVMDPTPHNNWPGSPHTFEQTVLEAFTELSS
jgi:hypothetical protein